MAESFQHTLGQTLSLFTPQGPQRQLRALVTPLPTPLTGLTCWRVVAGGRRVWAGEATCTWPRETGPRCDRLLAVRSAKRRERSRGSCESCVPPRKTGGGWAGGTEKEHS